jgi:predicted outer membrane repeat protein
MHVVTSCLGVGRLGPDRVRIGRLGVGRLATAVSAAVVVAAAVPLAAGAAYGSPFAPTAASKQFYVTAHGSSTGPCSKSRPCNSIGRAVSLANAIPFADTAVTINVGKGSFVTHLSFPDKPYPETALTITGDSPSGTTLTANGSGSVLSVFADAPRTTLENLAITGATGRSGEASGGGAVHDGGNFMDFDDVTFRDNTDAAATRTGGAVEDDGGIMTVTDSTFVDNSITSTVFGGGAIAEVGGTLSITGSLFTGNTVKGTGSGGAIYVNDGHLKLVSSTITGNAATLSATGGAIGVDETGRATVIGSTVNANSAGGSGGLVDSGGASTVSFGGDILVDNSGRGGSVCSGGGYHDLGYNVIDVSACNMGGKTKVASAGAVGLLPLAANGGPTRTERIKKTSAAHDVVPKTVKLSVAAFCAGQDERGVHRQQGPASKCDAGSYQFAPPVITSIVPPSGIRASSVTIHGFGFVFLALSFGNAHPAFSVSGEVTVHTHVAGSGTGNVTIRLSNPDGVATKSFHVLLPPAPS